MFSVPQQLQQNHKVFKETGKNSSFRTNKSTETAPEKDLTAHLADKDFETTVSKMLKN